MNSTTIHIPKIRRFVPYLAGGLAGIALTAGTILTAQHFLPHSASVPVPVAAAPVTVTAVPLPVASPPSAPAPVPVAAAADSPPPSISASPEKPLQQLSPDNSPDDYAGIPDTAVRKLKWAKHLVEKRDSSVEELLSSLIKDYEQYPRIVSESLYYLSIFNIQTNKPKKMNYALGLLERIASAYHDQPIVRKGKSAELVSDAISLLLSCGQDFDSLTGEAISYQPNYDLALRYSVLQQRLSPTLITEKRAAAAFANFESCIFVFPEVISDNNPIQYPPVYPGMITGDRIDISEKLRFPFEAGKTYTYLVSASFSTTSASVPHDPNTTLCFTYTFAKPNWIQQFIEDGLGLAVSKRQAAHFTRFYKGVIVHACNDITYKVAHYAEREQNAPSSMPVGNLFVKLGMRGVF